MITADLHTHTLYSHGADTPEAMWEAARQKGITLYGFAEHSPRPHNYTYTNEYRDKLEKYFPEYVAKVQALQSAYPGQILLGIEMDWMEKEVDFIRASIAAYPFDYVIGSVHFLQTWGYDDDPADWQSLHREHCHAHYAAYFQTLCRMAESKLFNIAAHIDLIKIFSHAQFTQWLEGAEAMPLVAKALQAIKDAGMAMEVSSAGLYKPCKEIYPGPRIMALAADMGLPIAFASDAHSTDRVAADFATLEAYARSYGYTQSVWYCQGTRYERPF